MNNKEKIIKKRKYDKVIFLMVLAHCLDNEIKKMRMQYLTRSVRFLLQNFTSLADIELPSLCVVNPTLLLSLIYGK